MNRGRSRRMRTLPFWAPRIALPSTESASWGTVTSALPRSTLVSTTVPARRAARIVWGNTDASVAASIV